MPPRTKLIWARGVASWITALAGVLVGAGLPGCDLTHSSERFVIRVDRIDAPLVVAPADSLRVRFHGAVGPNGCWWVERVDRHIGPATLEVTFRGAYEQHSGHDCPQLIVSLDHEEIVPPPLQLPFTVTVHQPDGTILQRRVDAPQASVTLLVINATCQTGQCLPLEIGGIVPKFAVPGQPPAGFLFLGRVEGASACLRFPVSQTLTIRSPVTTTTVTWTLADEVVLTASEGRWLPLLGKTDEFVPGISSGWSVTFPGWLGTAGLTPITSCMP